MYPRSKAEKETSTDTYHSGITIAGTVAGRFDEHVGQNESPPSTRTSRHTNINACPLCLTSIREEHGQCMEVFHRGQTFCCIHSRNAQETYCISCRRYVIEYDNSNIELVSDDSDLDENDQPSTDG